MLKITTEIQLSIAELLAAIEQLEPDDLEQVAQAAIVRRTRQHIATLSTPETELLVKINQGLPTKQQQRYQTLRSKRDAEDLTELEYQELLDLTQKSESLEVQRLQHLVSLAGLRQVSLTQLMTDLEIATPSYV